MYTEGQNQVSTILFAWGAEPMSGSTRNIRRALDFQVMGILMVSLTLSACMAKPTYIPTQEIPEDRPLSSGETQLGQRLYTNLNKKYPLSDDAGRVKQLERLVDHLSQAAGNGYANWQVHLLDAPEIVDLRAVAGNRIFVWSGLYEAIQNEDELAGLLAYEIAHDLARHTDPVRFNMMSNLMFQIGSLAGSTALMFASQGMVNLAGLDWIKLAYIEARDLGPEERYYTEIEERRAATIAMLMLQRSECRPEALIEFFWRTLEARPEQASFRRLHRRLTPDERLGVLEDLIANLDTQQPMQETAVSGISHPGLMPDQPTAHPAYR